MVTGRCKGRDRDMNRGRGRVMKMGMGMDSSFMGIMVDGTLKDGTLCGRRKERRTREGIRTSKCEEILGVEGGSTTSFT